MNFPMVSLSEIAKPIYRAVQVIPGQSYRTIGVKWWGEGAYERETIDGSQTAAKTLSLVCSGDLIINKIWVRHGSTAIASDMVDGCAASGEFPTFELDLLRVLPRWIHWQTKTKDFWGKCDYLSRGSSGKNRIKPELFLTIKIPLPSLNEQRRIVARIDELAAKIEESRKLRQQAEQDIRGILLGAYSSVISDACYLPMKEVAPLVRRPVEIKQNQNYPELGVRSFGKGTFHKPAINGAEIGTKKLFAIEPGDLLFNIVFAWEGAVAVAKPIDKGRVGSHRFLTCVPHEGITTSSFLCFHFLTQRGLQDLGTASPGGAGRNRTLGLKALDEIKVPIPAFEKQLWFDQLQAKLEAVRLLQSDTTLEMNALMPSILDKAFKGEL